MDTIRQLFAKPIDRRIEEVIKVDQADEQTVHDELQEYIITSSIGDHFISVFHAIADAPAEPHEGIGIWVSGFFGSGKSAFAKIVGYAVGDKTVCGQSASAMYKALLRELSYSEDFDLAELEISLEADGLLDRFKTEFESLHGKPWEIRRKLGRAINEASAVMHKLQPKTYNEPDSWAKGLGQGRADITPNLLAERAFEIAARRREGHALIFVIDEVGQYVSRSVDKMLDLQAVVQAFGREGKNRVVRKQAIAPCWIIVTSQEKLNEVVDALDSKKIELARLQDRFPLPIDLKQSDISEITSKRVLDKNPDYLKREHSYGSKVTGKSLDSQFGGLGYAWDRDVLRVVLAVLLRGGAIEVTHQGRKHRNHNDPACRQPFVNNTAFRAASFAPRESIDLKMLTDTARHYESITGTEVDIEEGAIAMAFQRLAAEDREALLPLNARADAAALPGRESLHEFLQTIEGVLEMPTDDCVKKLAGEGKSYQEARTRAQRLDGVLTDANLNLFKTARRIVDTQYPVLATRAAEELAQTADRLRSALESEPFFDQLGEIRQSADSLSERYRSLYRESHLARHQAYVAAIDEIKGLPEWTQVTENPDSSDQRRDSLIAPLLAKTCNQELDPDQDGLALADSADACTRCHATVAQMESETAAVESLKVNAIRGLQELAVPEKRIVRVRLSSVMGRVLESSEDVDQAFDGLRTHLLKLVAEDVRIVLE
jgi:hypothetical protein